MNDNWKESTLQKYQIEIVTDVSDNLFLASIPADEVIEFSEEPDVKYVEFGNTYDVALDMARPATDVTRVQDGFRYDGKTMKFNGTGIVTGLMDGGMDPNHPMFLDEYGDSRVKEVFDYNNNISAVTPSQIKAFTTDNTYSTHGTHVAGIMAGRAYKTGDYSINPSPVSGPTSNYNGRIPFYGVATGSDIIMAGGYLTTNNIIKGINAVADYAEKHGQPFVVNLSIQSNEGPHDGTGLLESAFSKIGKKGIVCVASGNDGDKKIFAGKKLTAADNSMKTFFANNYFKGADLWSNDERPLTVTVSFYSNGTITPLARITAANQTASPSQVKFTEYMNGSITMKSEVNSLNNRFHVSLSGSFSEKASGAKVMISVDGVDGQQVYLYGTGGTIFASDRVEGFTDGSYNGSINNLATANDIIAVGSYTTRNCWGTFVGAYAYADINAYPVGKVSPFTGFGYAFNGTPLPTACAPGAMIQSSLNRYYTKSLDSGSLNRMCARVNSEPTAYWGEIHGTSMASPFMAGTVALWLQADPTLKQADVVSILKKTCINPLGYNATEDEKLRWGAGRLDAMAGIKEVLARKAAGVQGVLADDYEAIITMTSDRTISISVPSASGIAARLYNMQGIEAAAAQSAGSDVELDATGTPSGVYILSVETAHGNTTTHRMLLK
ncbi:MAG: S8 family peptidase [Muribaculaceae bacterium]|nr:S8 family peptidase [Muribaculaceae bacterium]